MRKAKSSSRWQGIFTALGFGSRENATKTRPPGSHSLRLEPLEQRTLLSAAAQCDHILSDPQVWTATHIYGAGPADLRSTYGVDSIRLGSIVGDGSGETIAIVDAYDNPGLVSSTAANFANSDLHQFDAVFGLSDPASFQKIDQTGGTSYPAENDSWVVEEDLDVEWAHAIAPAANIVLVEARTPYTDDLMTAVKYAASIPGVVAVSMSWGGGEYAGESASDADFNVPGVTFVASTGDGGAQSGYPANSPACSPYVVAVGGTQLTAPGGVWTSETGWPGSGGGQSQYEAEPPYQQAVQASGYRQIPDVAFDADPKYDAVAIYSYLGVASDTPWTAVGGTSLGSPCWAGLVTIADQLRASEGLPSLSSVQTQSRLYQLPSSDFHDITTGSNGEYSAGPGYDMVTGLGSPVANALVPDLVSAPGADLYVTVTDSGNFTQCDIGDTYTITVSNIGDSPTIGEIDLANVLPSGLTATGFTCSDPNSDWTIHSATLTAACDDSLAAGASFPALTLTVNVASDAPATVTDTATVSGGGEVNTANDVGTDLTTIIPGGPVCTWTGGGTDNNWTTAANWDIAPAAGSRLVFAGTTRQSPVNNFPVGTTFDSITIDTSGFTLSGSAVTLSAPGGVAIDDADGENTFDLPITLGADGEFDVIGAGALYLTPNAAVSLGGHDLSVYCSIDSTASQWAAPITGAGGFAMYGGGTLTLTSSSTYSGDTSIEDGTLVLTGGINRDNHLPVTTNLYLGAGALFGVLQLGNAGGRSDQTVAGLYGADYHSSVVGGYEAILPDADSRLTVMMSAGSQDTYYGSFGGTEGAEGKLAVVLQSTPQFVTEFDLIGGGNYDGGTTVASVQFFPAGADDVGTGPVTLDNGSLWLLEGTLANEIVADANTQDGIVELAPSGLTIAGDLSGSGEIDTSGNMFALSGDNSGFTGTFYQAGGTTTYLTSPSAGSAGATWWIDGGTLAADLSSNPTNQPIELGALKGTVPRYYGTVTNVGIPVTFEVGANGQSTQFRGVIADGSGSSTVALTKVGAGTLTLTGASTYSGGTTVENGTLALAGGDNRLPVGTFVVLGDDQGDSGVLQLGDGTTACNQTLAGLYLAGGSASRAVGGATAVGTLTVAPPADSTDEYDGLLGGSGTNENDLALTKVGPASRLTLTGANTYSGVTTIVSGTLDIANTTAINTMLNSTLSAGVNDTGGFLIFDYSGGTDPNATVLTLLTAAYNGGVNSFLSGQIRDSSATTLIGLGWVDNTTTMQITIMPAIYGDVNLDGVVNFSDLNKVLTNYNLTGMVWSQGDVNYNGVVNFSDLNKVLTNYNLTGPLNIQDAP